MNILLLSMLTGCWKEFDKLPQIDRKAFPFENEYLETQDVMITIVPTSLRCPDGKPASFFTVYPPSEDPLPVAIVFHAGAVGYVSDYSASQGRFLEHLETEWAENKVWETMGMAGSIPGSEKSNGAITAALADAGFIQLYPINCWGDYWHNDPELYNNAENIEEQEDTSLQDVVDVTRFSRQGLTMAKRIVDILQEPSVADEEGFEIPTNYNTTQIYWVGLGDGGRAIIELLLQGESAQGVLLDSTPMDLQPYVNNQTFPLESQTISQVFVGDGGFPFDDLSAWSWSTVTNWPDKTGLIWSNGGSGTPKTTIEGAAEQLLANGYWVKDTNQTGHIFLNQNINLARGSVQFLLTGVYAEPEDVEDTDETESSEEGPEDTAQ